MTSAGFVVNICDLENIQCLDTETLDLLYGHSVGRMGCMDPASLEYKDMFQFCKAALEELVRRKNISQSPHQK
jgi:hypothetical protein